jgi:hypothetical protein
MITLIALAEFPASLPTVTFAYTDFYYVSPTSVMVFIAMYPDHVDSYQAVDVLGVIFAFKHFYTVYRDARGCLLHSTLVISNDMATDNASNTMRLLLGAYLGSHCLRLCANDLHLHVYSVLSTT